MLHIQFQADTTAFGGTLCHSDRRRSNKHRRYHCYTGIFVVHVVAARMSRLEPKRIEFAEDGVLQETYGAPKVVEICLLWKSSHADEDSLQQQPSPSLLVGTVI